MRSLSAAVSARTAAGSGSGAGCGPPFNDGPAVGDGSTVGEGAPVAGPTVAPMGGPKADGVPPRTVTATRTATTPNVVAPTAATRRQVWARRSRVIRSSTLSNGGT